MNMQKELPRGVLSIGDDCSVVPLSRDLLQITSTDCLVENIHFKLEYMSFRELGYKALAVNISDIAAMGGKPLWAHVSLAIPSKIDLDKIEELYRGLSALAEQEGIHILGGDLSSSPHDFFINVVIAGEVSTGLIKYRAGFKPNQVICVNKPLGGALAGLRLLEQGAGGTFPSLVSECLKPQTYIEEGQWLARNRSVGGMMDCSDGLLSSLKQLETSLKIGATIDLEKLPMTPDFQEACKDNEWDSLEVALAGGEEYCLIFSVDKESVAGLQKEYFKKFSEKLYVVGEIGGVGVEVRKNGGPYKYKTQPFSHF